MRESTGGKEDEKVKGRTERREERSATSRVFFSPFISLYRNLFWFFSRGMLEFFKVEKWFGLRIRVNFLHFFRKPIFYLLQHSSQLLTNGKTERGPKLYDKHIFSPQMHFVYLDVVEVTSRLLTPFVIIFASS